MDFAKCFANSAAILMEGALGERLKREYGLLPDENVALAAHVYGETSGKALKELFNQYINISLQFNLPIMITAPTRRANKDRILRSRYDENIIMDNVTFLREIKAGFSAADSSDIYIGGLMGCKGNAYQGTDVLTEKEAKDFHLWQASLFEKAKVDFLYAGIMPALSEAVGMAQAMESTGLPYIISFMIRKDGRLIDGTAINEAISIIDGSTGRKPLCYMTNCVHPTIVSEALHKPINQTPLVRERFKGIQANTSALSPEELDNSCDLKTSDAISLARDMEKLKEDFSFKIFGGCCGTDDSHMREIAKILSLIS